MELCRQIKKYRAQLNLSQEELAEKVYVSRQTISNWETEKSYPDIHSLLLLSSLFGISLDELIKGDIEVMKKEIIQDETHKEFNSLGNILTVLFAACLITPLPLAKFLGWAGLALYCVLFAVTMYFALRVEKIKKANNIQTYKEIVAFTNGEKLDEIAESSEKRKSTLILQNILKCIISAAAAALVCFFMSKLLM